MSRRRVASKNCDLCGEHGISAPAIADVRTPSGMWAFVCAAHAYRLSARCECGAELGVDHGCPAMPSCAGEEMMPLGDAIEALGPHPIEPCS